MSREIEPIPASLEPKAAPVSAAVVATATQQRVLVVDDDRALRRLAGQVLSSAGYAVEMAADGEEALGLFQSFRPDVVLLDVVMPGADGFQTLSRLRALPRGKSTPVVLVTGLSDLTSVQRAIESGADDFVSKPFDVGELILRIRSLLGRKKAEAKDPGSGPMRETLTTLLVHDLKHPLTTIYFNAGLLRRDPDLSQKALDKVRRILRASETLENMVLSILDVTRSEHGALTIRATDFDLGELLDEVTGTMSAQAELNGQRLEVSLTGSRRVRADRDLLRRALENLIDNATSYAPPGTAIRVESSTTAETLDLRVRDEGPGVPPERRREVFEKYVQSTREGVRGRKGRGLGLVFVRIAAEAHGGRVWIDEVATGSCFCVRVPQSGGSDGGPIE